MHERTCAHVFPSLKVHSLKVRIRGTFCIRSHGGFPGGSTGKENPHGQRGLVGYSQWGPKESDSTERLSTAHSTSPVEPQLAICAQAP